MNLKYFGNSTRKATGQGVKRRYFKTGRHLFRLYMQDFFLDKKIHSCNVTYE